MTPRIIPIQDKHIIPILEAYDNWQIDAQCSATASEYSFWKMASGLIPELATGHWALDMSVPLHPVFIECRGNEQ